MTSIPRLSSILYMSLAILVAFSVFPGDSSALLTVEEKRALSQSTFHGGATPISGVPCEAGCTALRASEQRPMPTTAATRELVQETSRLRKAVKVLPRALGRIAPPPAGAVEGTFLVGWAIGTGIRKVWIGATVPAPTTTPADPLRHTGYYPVEKGEVRISNGVAEIRMPADGFVPELNDGAVPSARAIDESYPGSQPDCVATGPEPSLALALALALAGWQTLRSATFSANYACGPWIRHFEDLFTPFVARRSDGLGLGGPEPWAGQPTTQPDITYWPGQPGSETELETRTETELQARPEEYRTLEQKTKFELGTPDVCDPVEPFVCNDPDIAQRERQKRCELGDRGTGRDPDPARGQNRSDPILWDTHHGGLFRRELNAGPTDPLVPTELKKGYTYVHPAPLKAWGGWGWRHVDAKHGWRGKDIRATTVALALEPIRQPKTGRLQYTGPQYRQNGEKCERIVIVEPVKDWQGNGPPQIVTSYGGLVRPSP